jgi:shikimate kinase
MEKEPRHLWLLGLSGSGKSTIGPRLARALSMPWVDTDAEIARDAGKPIPEIFQQEGEEGFRQRESRILEKIAAGPASVVSCGGGVVIRDTNRHRMTTTGLRIYLQTDPATLAQRLRASQDRPLLAGDKRETTLQKLLAERSPWYEESELSIDVTHLKPDEVVSAIQKKLPAPWSR